MTDELKHYGILGMKWGKRRSRVTSDDHNTARAIGKKRLDEMTNDELKKLTTRLQLERQYKDLSKKQLSTGQKIVSGLLKEAGKEVFNAHLKKPLMEKGVPIIAKGLSAAILKLIQKKTK